MLPIFSYVIFVLLEDQGLPEEVFVNKNKIKLYTQWRVKRKCGVCTGGMRHSLFAKDLNSC